MPADTLLQPLTARQMAFAVEYLIDLNGTQAAIRAGYSANGASVTGTRLLSDPSVAAMIEKAKAQRLTRTKITQDQVLNEMALLAMASVDHFFVDDLGHLRPKPDAPEGIMAAIASVKRTVRIDEDDNITFTVEFKLWDKPGTLKLMGKHVGLFPDRMEHVGPNGGPIETVTRVERVIVSPAKR